MVHSANSKLIRLYNIVKTETLKAQWLRYDPGVLVSGSHHKWGDLPYHFISNPYNGQIAQIEGNCFFRAIVNDRHYPKLTTTALPIIMRVEYAVMPHSALTQKFELSVK